MIRLRRRNTAWLSALGILIAFALLAAGQANPAVQALLLGIFAVAMIASLVELGSERETIMDAIRKAPVRQRISPQAKEAAERARSRGGYASQDMMLMDVGLIASQSSYDGMALRRTRSISKDDDGARPFVTLYVDPMEAERMAVVRFEIINQYGEEAYIHEMKTYLRDGEISIMADHHLPLAGNRDIQGAGDWDLRVYIDGNLAGLHNFMLAPSIAERSRRLASQQGQGDRGAASEYFEIIDEPQQEDPQEMPLSLQDLLHEESLRESRQQRTDTNSESNSAGTTRRRTTTTTRRRR